MGQSQVVFRHLIIHFPTSLRVSERANEWAQQSARTNRAVWSKRMSEWCEWTSERRSEWPSTLRVDFTSFQPTVQRSLSEGSSTWQANEWAVRANEWAVRANQQANERMAQCDHPNFIHRLFWIIVHSCLQAVLTRKDGRMRNDGQDENSCNHQMCRRHLCCKGSYQTRIRITFYAIFGPTGRLTDRQSNQWTFLYRYDLLIR